MNEVLVMRILQCFSDLLGDPKCFFPQADRIIVLDKGQVLETGNHTELMAADGLYARIFGAQALVSRVNGRNQTSILGKGGADE